jgi:hypothetical protein
MVVTYRAEEGYGIITGDILKTKLNNYGMLYHSVTISKNQSGQMMGVMGSRNDIRSRSMCNTGKLALLSLIILTIWHKRELSESYAKSTPWMIFLIWMKLV